LPVAAGRLFFGYDAFTPKFAKMIFYHYTRASRLQSIMEHGLKPQIPRLVTFGKPVVWLTTDNDDLKWRLAPNADDVRLSVQLDRNNSRLAHFSTWLRNQRHSFVGPNGVPGTTDDILALLSPSAVANWYVYFGQVAPHRITVK
jgi:hypothetical protein